MKKTLIYLEEDLLAPKGGPYAVGFFIQDGLKKLNIKDIEFIKKSNTIKKAVKKSKFANNKFLIKIYRIIKNYKYYNEVLNRAGILKADINQYAVLHFHKTQDMYAARNALRDYKGTVILTSHSPVPLSQEVYSGLNNIEKILFKKLYSKLYLMDEYAFKRADIIHFPCVESEEPYYKYMENYKQIKSEKKNSYFYLPTGIIPCFPKRSTKDIRKELGIPYNDFCMCYVGRHNVVKGYGNLKKMGKKLLDQSQDNWMIVAGKEEPIKRLNHCHWKEIGFTDDAYSYISASDIFILPNLETYFDIVMLEVLSLGKIVVASRTGGNKYFEGKSKGIFLYDSIDEAITIIKDLKWMKNEDRKLLEIENKKLFDENFSNVVYTKRYANFISTL